MEKLARKVFLKSQEFEIGHAGSKVITIVKHK